MGDRDFLFTLIASDGVGSENKFGRSNPGHCNMKAKAQPRFWHWQWSYIGFHLYRVPKFWGVNIYIILFTRHYAVIAFSGALVRHCLNRTAANLVWNRHTCLVTKRTGTSYKPQMVHLTADTPTLYILVPLSVRSEDL